MILRHGGIGTGINDDTFLARQCCDPGAYLGWMRAKSTLWQLSPNGLDVNSRDFLELCVCKQH